MIFYSYTLKKMLKSVSTYVTLLIAMLPTWGYGFSVLRSSGSSETMGMIEFFTIPLLVIFLSFKASQVFRDEIENQTLLVIQSKPISRIKLVMHGYLSLATIILIATFLISFIPGLTIIKTEGVDALLSSFLTFITQLVIALTISALALFLSLSLKGKAFIGVMLSIFGIGFYTLFGIMFYLKVSNNLHDKIGSQVPVGVGITNNVQIEKVSSNNSEYTLTVLGDLDGASAEEVYNKTYASFKKQEGEPITVYNVIKWIDPVTHFQRMYGANTEVPTISSYNLFGSDLISMFKGNQKRIYNIHELVEEHKFSFQIENNASIPLWYPFLIWITIGSIIIPITMIKLSKRNIS